MRRSSNRKLQFFNAAVEPPKKESEFQI